MWSRSGSAFEPSSVTSCPLTSTWPLEISCSALRREVTPAAAMIFCNRSSVICDSDCRTYKKGTQKLNLALGSGVDRSGEEKRPQSIVKELLIVIGQTMSIRCENR